MLSDALDLESERSAQCGAARVSDSKAELIDFLWVSSDVLSNAERNRKINSCLSSDLLLNWQVHSLDRNIVSGQVSLLVSEGDGAAILPRPVSVVEYFNVSETCLTSSDLDDAFGLALENGTLLVEGFLGLTLRSHLLLAELDVSLPLLSVAALPSSDLVELRGKLLLNLALQLLGALVLPSIALSEAADNLFDHVVLAATALGLSLSTGCLRVSWLRSLANFGTQGNARRHALDE